MVLKPMKLSQLMISRRRKKKNTKTKADREHDLDDAENAVQKEEEE